MNCSLYKVPTALSGSPWGKGDHDVLKNNDSSGSLHLAFLTVPLSMTFVSNVVSGQGQGQAGLCPGRVREGSSASPRKGRSRVGRASSPAEILPCPCMGRSDCLETVDYCTGIKLGELKTRINHRHAYLHMKRRLKRFMVINMQWLIKVH